ncbi:phospholipid carrier-dependent glycosyltransferase [Pseudomonas sp. RIT-PI-AD]|uniref:phospholipid carrier-dependent glycosyltransferase n=1 Tax=Pseudomonas sp. RIT-PI-AD TaxID=3035294 RepID=UPI0021D8DD28|nr:phospholipid carrier-dependent glycosyltransferase [Pseudomonas sp. RIT-PI-AD]
MTFAERGRPHWLPLALLLAAALASRFLLFGHPRSAVIDEVYFAEYLSSYLTGDFYFDIHPPLARLLIAGFAASFGCKPVPFGTPWNLEYPDQDYLVLRFLPGLVGSLLPLLGYGLFLRLFRRRRLAFFGAGLLLLDNALLVQSRFLFFDVFLLAAGFASLLCYLYHRERGGWGWLLTSAVLAGAAVSVKWVALPFVLLPVALDYLGFMLGERRLRSVLKTAVAMLAGGVSLYLLVFAVHLHLLPHSGPGNAYVSPAFQQTLEDSPYAGRDDIQPLSFFGRLVELHQAMYAANQRMGGHPYSSRWYQWPLNEKPLAYWRQGEVDIALKGNSLLWWAGSASVALLGLILALKPALWRDPVASLALLGYLANWLPFALIDRVMFIHHYLPALIFSVIALGWLVARVPWLARHAPWLLLPFALGFVAQAPQSYGLAPW